MDLVPSLSLVLGHAASGKSLWAERDAAAAAARAGVRPTYVATARAWDDETRDRIAAHVARRADAWDDVEAPLDPGRAVAGARGVVLIDCMTMWLTNMLLDGHDCGPAVRDLIDVLRGGGAAVWIVSNDVGGGVVPDNALARRFQSIQGEANQALAAAADRVVLVTAGLPQVLK